MMFRPTVLPGIARRVALGLGGTAAVGGTAFTAYLGTEQGLGLRRELRFWGSVAPIVADYWFHVSSSSPWVKFQQRFGYGSEHEHEHEHEKNIDEHLLDDEDEDYSGTEEDSGNHARKRALVFKTLHERNAPLIYATLLELGGLYIKLGQVLSVTALPVPTEYRTLFRTLQSCVPGHEGFVEVVKPALEAELGRPLGEVFESIEEIPCGAASIGQAHRATLNDGNGTEVVVKIQYPDAKWQVPADVKCVGDFLGLCVWFGVVDESSARLSYDEFARQFLAELDYREEANNLREVYESSLDPGAPYQKRGVEIPRAIPELCTDTVLTMTYLPGPKFEEEARRQLEALGIDTSRGVRSVVRDDGDRDHPVSSPRGDRSGSGSWSPNSNSKPSWAAGAAETVGAWVGVDALLFLVRLARKVVLWSRAVAVRTIQGASGTALPVSMAWVEWAGQHKHAVSQAEMLDWTEDAIDALFDVHGYQIFHQGLFHADAHPGNILVIPPEHGNRNRSKLGLIDYGQCKRLTPDEQQRIARLILGVANDEPDEKIAGLCRELGFKTKNDSTEFLSTFARLMFGRFKSEYFSHDWHKSLHERDEIVYFPNELSMVYRASLLLRGLAMSFQLNVSVGEKWREHAQAHLDRFSLHIASLSWNNRK
eukprot:jgi/Psemu1/294161/fgenesh1_pm.9_\